MIVINFILLCFAAQMTVLGMFFILLTYPTPDNVADFFRYLSTNSLEAGGVMVRMDAGFTLAVFMEIIIFRIIRWQTHRSKRNDAS